MSSHFDSSHHASAHFDSSHYNRGVAVVITPGGGLDEDSLWRLDRLRRQRRISTRNLIALLQMLVSIIDNDRD